MRPSRPESEKPTGRLGRVLLVAWVFVTVFLIASVIVSDIAGDRFDGVIRLLALTVAALVTCALAGIRRLLDPQRRRSRCIRLGRCPRCRYDIDGLPVLRCPKCGEMW